MFRNASKSNDPIPYEEKAKKTIRNMEAAEAAMEFAEGKERAAIKAKNARRRKSLGWSSEENDDSQD